MEKIIQISQNLYQFTNQTAIIIVAAKQEGRVFQAGDGELVFIDQFRIPTPKFSDKEGFPGEEGKRENKVEAIIQTEYLDYFKKLFHSLARNLKPTHIYLFAPVHTAKELRELTKPIFGAIPVKIINGIFTDESPQDLLKRLG